MTLWELHACVDGWMMAKGAGATALTPPTDEEFDAWVRH